MSRLVPSSKKPPLAAAVVRQAGLARYGSAPGSLLSSIAESVIGGGDGSSGEFLAAGASDAVAERFFGGDSPCLTSESSCRVASAAAAASPPDLERSIRRVECGRGMFPQEYGGFREFAGGSHLIRHSSSPAGFFADLLMESGLSQPKGVGNCSQMAGKRLSSQWSFSQQDSLSQISETTIADMAESIIHGNKGNEAAGNLESSFNRVPFCSWDDTHSIVFNSAPHKRAKDNNEDTIATYSNLDPQLSLPCTSLEMEAVEKYLQVQQDIVHCKLRAKRGCATHPRSIAERERRTRISKRLRKLQELVPNMDKQTNTSDMLDLAVEYIKELQSQIKKLNQEHAECTCIIKLERA
ncbi:Transcription factor bHLH128 [Apostasia shenzhenica]|uniref:Transcription factor bHLH128 n=1 Tax=Apostasia shenzhenica TaxID=1088818 RepID=A0A2I0AA61_9ASPA|nr:Transcription factor bHLH128 [Apostasia shenzhenica]